MQNSVTATLTAARSAESTLVAALHGAADALDTVARDPLGDAVRRLAEAASAAKSRLDAARADAGLILASALLEFEDFASEVTATPNGSESPTPELAVTPTLVALEIRPTPNGSESGGFPRTPRSESEEVVELAPVPEPESVVEECEGCFDLTADVISREDGVRRCPSCERSRMDALAVEARVEGAYADRSAEEVLTTAANSTDAEPVSPAPKKPRGRGRKAK